MNGFRISFNYCFIKKQYRNVTIVDTPGIEDTVEFQTMLEEYIPEAVAFVIVIDVSRARGLQKDKVLFLSPGLQVCDCQSIHRISIAQWSECWHGTPEAMCSSPG